MKKIGALFLILTICITVLCGFSYPSQEDSVIGMDNIGALMLLHEENVQTITYANGIALDFLFAPERSARSSTSKTGYGRFYHADTNKTIANFSLAVKFSYDGTKVEVTGTPVTTCKLVEDGYTISAEAPETSTTGPNASGSCVFELQYNGSHNNSTTITVYCTKNGTTSSVVN